MAALTISSAPLDEPLTLAEAKRHLRVLHDDLDDEITTLIGVARDYAERFAERTLRTSVSRVLKQSAWWCSELWLPFPPLLSVTSITYYDTSNASQTLASANYAVEISTDGGGRLTWKTDATIPGLYSRVDAITITFATGYSAASGLPPIVVQALKCKLTELFGVGSETELRAAREATDRLLRMADWSGYA